MKKKSFSEIISGIVTNQMFIPVAALVILVIFNLINDPSFFRIDVKTNYLGNTVLGGNLISILDFGSELAILAVGMTFVTAASGGQDISVGASIAIAGSVIIKLIRGDELYPTEYHMPIIFAFLIGCIVVMLFGAFNGILVAYFNIQPMVATLILFTAGRSIAQWINTNANCNIGKQSFKYFGDFIPGIPIPTPFIIAAAFAAVVAIVMKLTNISLYSQAVGINNKSARLNGLNPTAVKLMAFIILGFCAGIVGLIKVSRASAITYSTIAKDIEMDAILAVALGGNALGGGKFNMKASILGAYVIQFLTTTLYKMQVSAAALPAYKAVVVIILVVVGSPVVRGWLDKVTRRADTLRVKEVA